MTSAVMLTVLVLMVVLVAGPVGSASATTWQITRLTNNSVADAADELAEGFAVWRHWDGHDSELYLRTIIYGLDKQITDNETNDLCARLDGGRLVWENVPLSGATPHYTQIMIMAPPDGTPSALTGADLTRVVTDNQAGNVCWNEFPRGTGPAQCWHYSVGTGIATRVTDTTVDGLNPTSDGRWVAYTRQWRGVGVTPWDRVMLYDLATNTTRELNPNLNWREQSVKLYGSGKLLYLSHDGNDSEVWMADLLAGTRTQISDNDRDDGSPALDDTMVAYCEMKPGFTDDDPAQYKIHLFDLALGSEVWASDFMYDLGSPDFEGGLLVWSARETSGSDSEIWVFDTATRVVTQVTDNDYEDNGAHTDGRRILWTGAAGTAPAGSASNACDEVFLADSYVLPATPFFSDVPSTHPYYTAIEGLRLAGAVGGYETAGGWEFRPAATAFRAQFAKMICETLGLTVTEDIKSSFTDLGVDDPSNLYPHEYVAVAASKGITSGTGLSRFSPYTSILRAQVVTMIVRAADSLAPGTLQASPAGFEGTLGDFSSVHAESMRKAECNGLLSGLQSFDETWDPWAAATRGEMAAMLWALKELL